MGLSEARYAREDGVYHRLNPKPESGILRAGEEFGFIVRYGGEFQLCYSIAGRELVNLPLAKEFIEMLGNFYDITSAKDGAANAEGV
jgi:hypothetical protein